MMTGLCIYSVYWRGVTFKHLVQTPSPTKLKVKPEEKLKHTPLYSCEMVVESHEAERGQEGSKAEDTVVVPGQPCQIHLCCRPH